MIPFSVLNNLRQQQVEAQARATQARQDSSRLEEVELALLLMNYQHQFPDLSIYFHTNDGYSSASDCCFGITLERAHHPESDVDFGMDPGLYDLNQNLRQHPDYLEMFPPVPDDPQAQYQELLHFLDMGLSMVRYQSGWDNKDGRQRSHLLDLSQPIEWEYWFETTAGPVRAEAERIAFECQTPKVSTTRPPSRL